MSETPPSLQLPLINSFGLNDLFRRMYPISIRLPVQTHCSFPGILSKSRQFLAAEYNVQVPDIRCGAGKSCKGGVYYKPHAFYYGAEQQNDSDFVDKIDESHAHPVA